ncbi:DUF3267 domain-containing protein [Haloprofundus salilacus]|uniref:DUF3267 domain-containing protein n=1 Tax=Haloprofundus salilacus TaxID=2876190 RepID=UPI001CCC0F0C|nr:DUF3267 domain-containing protein [Haloprofundus salilacus]
MNPLGESPDGYGDYLEYDVPEKWIVGLVLLLVVGLGEFFFPGVVGWFFVTVGNGPTGFVMVSLDELLFLVGMIVVHEAIHYVAALRQGYNPTAGVRLIDSFYGIKEPSPYIIVLNEHISRKHNLVMLIAPLLVINAIALLGLLPIFPVFAAYYAKIALVANTASSMQDVYNFVRLWTMDEGTQFINVEEDEIRSFYCQPQS